MATLAAQPLWDLTAYYPSLESAEFKADLKLFADQISTLESWSKLNLTQIPEVEGQAKAIDHAITQFNCIFELSRLLAAYVSSFTNTDSRDENAQAVYSSLNKDFVRLMQVRTVFTDYVGRCDLAKVLNISQIANDHEYALQLTVDAASHLMSAPEEDLAADLSLSGSSAWGKLHGNLCSQIEVSVPISGRDEVIPISMARNYAYDGRAEVREAAYHAEIAGWTRNETALAACMNGVKGEVVMLSDRRKWSSPLESSLFAAHIDEATLDAMMSAAQESFPTFRRYLRAKSRALGSGDQLPWWNLFAPLGGGEEAWTWDRAESFIVETFGEFSGKMADFAKTSFQDRWIDAPTRPGKRDGAYCTGTRDGKSLILMNYKESFGSVSTLAHELGHGYHNLCLKDRTYCQSGTPMTLAETASIFCETIIRHKGLASGTDSEKLNILEAAISGYCQVVVDITSRFQFEKGVFEKRRERELSASELCSLMTEAQLATYGDGMDPSVLHPYMWAVKPHYYGARSFYNFPYMFGLLFAMGLYAVYTENPDGFKSQYDDLLASTGMADAATLANRFGIDIRSIDFWKGSLSVIASEIDQFEALVQN